MKMTPARLRQIILAEIRSELRKPVKPRNRSLASLIFEEDEKPAEKGGGNFAALTATTNIKDVNAEDVYNQLVSKDASAPIFNAMAGAKPRGFNIDPEKCAAHFEDMGKGTFVERLKDIQGKIPDLGLPKDQMPVLPNPRETELKGTVDQLVDILGPGGKYNVDFESVRRSGSPMTESFIYNRWSKLAGIISEKVDPPAPNELSGGTPKAEKYLKSGLEDGDDTDDNIKFQEPGKVAAASAIPTQTNILIGKTIGMAIPRDAGGGGIEGGPLGAYAGIDGEILDGHHRWAATMISNPTGDLGTVMSIDLAQVGGGDKKTGLRHLTAIGNALGNATKTESRRFRK